MDIKKVISDYMNYSFSNTEWYEKALYEDDITFFISIIYPLIVFSFSGLLLMQ